MGHRHAGPLRRAGPDLADRGQCDHFPFYKRGRICAHPGCPTILSILTPALLAARTRCRSPSAPGNGVGRQGGGEPCHYRSASGTLRLSGPDPAPGLIAPEGGVDQ